MVPFGKILRLSGCKGGMGFGLIYARVSYKRYGLTWALRALLMSFFAGYKWGHDKQTDQFLKKEAHLGKAEELKNGCIENFKLFVHPISAWVLVCRHWNSVKKILRRGSALQKGQVKNYQLQIERKRSA